MMKTILVVEDQEDNRRILRDLLANAGYQMVEAEDGEQALVQAAKCDPDLILMDIQLPLMDGYEATRRLKADPMHKNVRIVALTAYAMKGDEEKALAAGCDGYLSKPIDTRTFPRMVASFLGDPADPEEKR